MTKNNPHLPQPTPTQSNNPNNPHFQNPFEKRGRELLNAERPKISQFKTGIHQGRFYFGSALYDPQRQIVPVIITNDRHIFHDWSKALGDRPSKTTGYNEIQESFGLYYRFPMELDVLDRHWSVASIKGFLEGTDQNKSLSELHEQLVAQNKLFMYYADERIHDYVALDIISTYLLPCFEAKGRTFLEAEKGSGKTRQCTIYKLLACNPVMSPDITKSSFFRLMESTISCLIVDDFDSIGDEQKADVLQHYRSGYKDVGKSVRQSDDRVRNSVAFRNYGHVVMNNTSGLDDISADRSVFLPMLKVTGAITVRNIMEVDSYWQELRDGLYVASLTNWSQVKRAYDDLYSAYLSGRQFEIVRPILALAEVISPALRESMEHLLLDLFGQSGRDLDDDWDYIGLCAFFEYGENKPYRLRALAEHVASKTGLDANDRDYKKRLHGINTRLGRVFRCIPLFKLAYPGGSCVVTLKDFDGLRKYFIAKSWPLPGIQEPISGGQLGSVGVNGLKTPPEDIIDVKNL